MKTADRSLQSSYRELLLEHLFVGEVMRHLWVSGGKRLEILKPYVNDAGYDLVFELDKIVRHIQLKTSFEGSTVRRFNINAGLAAKLSGCGAAVSSVSCSAKRISNLDLSYGAVPLQVNRYLTSTAFKPRSIQRATHWE